jgi:HPt (histidine-containing phosphotransfer) domain-containing protein
MRDSDQSRRLPDANISEALDLMWARYQPQILERVAVLEAAAGAVTAKSLTASEREAAHAAAHKLAGSLGMFNLERGTDLARELEAAYKLESPPAPDEADRLVSLAAELRAMIENRKPGIRSRKSGIENRKSSM